MTVHEKTWQTAIGGVSTLNQYFASHGTGQHLADARAIARQGIFNAMLGFGSSPWIPLGSSKGTVGNAAMDGVNRLQTDADLIFANASGTAHSWLAMQQGEVELVADLVGHSSNGSAGSSIQFIMSPSLGFGAATGGTDGSHTTRPTALDEIVLSVTNVGWLGNAVNQTTSRDYIVSVMMTEDGTCTRIFIRAPHAGTFSAMGLFETVKEPVIGWSTPVCGRWLGSTSYASVATYAQWLYQPLMIGRLAAGAGQPMYLTSRGWGGQAAGERLTSHNELSGEWDGNDVGLASENVLCRGQTGKMFDMYWVPSILPDGFKVPPGLAGDNFAVIGDMIQPWDDSAVRLV